jgi:hypothetical protein
MDYLQITPYIRSLAELSERNNGIKPEMYLEHDVKRGLRDLNGNGVVTGLTEISCIKSKEIGPNGGAIPCEGELSDLAPIFRAGHDSEGSGQKYDEYSLQVPAYCYPHFL